MEARARFVLEAEAELCTMTELCRIYEISRETGYYWLRRYRVGGMEALRDLGRAPERHPNQDGGRDRSGGLAAAAIAHALGAEEAQARAAAAATGDPLASQQHHR